VSRCIGGSVSNERILGAELLKVKRLQLILNLKKTIMTTLLDRIDPELAEALANLPIGSDGLLDVTNIPKARESVRQIAESIAQNTPDDPRISVQEYRAKSYDGYEVPIRMLRPKSAIGPVPLLVWFHAGGQILGFAAQDDPLNKMLIAKTGCAIASVDYRLAPEYPSPTGAKDGFAAWKWLVKSAEDLQIDSERMAIAGGSGGGCIAAATTLLIRDHGAKAPKFQALICPMLDDRNETPSSKMIEDIGIWDRKTNIFAWKNILGEKSGSNEVSVYSAPARETNFKNLPETFIAVGELDLFRDESLNYALGLQQDNIPVELHLYPRAYHSFNVFAPKSQLTLSFNSTWQTYIKRQFGSKEID